MAREEILRGMLEKIALQLLRARAVSASAIAPSEIVENALEELGKLIAVDEWTAKTLRQEACARLEKTMGHMGAARSAHTGTISGNGQLRTGKRSG